MKKLIWIASLLISFSTLTSAQVYLTKTTQLPNIVGMPGIDAVRVGDGWTLTNAMIFKVADKRSLQLIVGPSRTHMLAVQVEKLSALSLKATDEIPEEFYVVPDNRTILYHCLHSIPRHTLFCKRVIISTKPALLHQEGA